MSLLAVDMRLPACRSLKEKRGALKPIIEGARRRFLVAAAEVGYQDLRQRAEVAFAVVSSSPGRADHVLDEVDRFIWSHPEVDVLSSGRFYLDADSDRAGCDRAGSDRAGSDREPLPAREREIAARSIKR